jgi:hypothetical protein
MPEARARVLDLDPQPGSSRATNPDDLASLASQLGVTG